MTLTKLEQEEIWIEGWNVLNDLLEQHSDSFILIQDFVEVSIAEAQQWIQDIAYTNSRVQFNVDYYKGKKSIFISKVFT